MSFFERARLNGKHALVLGGAGYVGRTICETLSELGASVSIGDIQAPTDSVHRAYEIDLEDADAIRSLVRDVEKESTESGKTFDVLVHCASLVGTSNLKGWGVPFDEQELGAWEKAMSINLNSAFIASQEFARHCNAREHVHGASIVYVSSIYGIRAPRPSLYAGTTIANPVAYGASKAGLNHLAAYLAVYLAPNIRVNVISPGGIIRAQDPSFVDRYQEMTPLGRMANESDLVGAVGFLCSDLSSYVTGQNLVVDGGWSL